MPGIEENLATWDASSSWSAGGEEWSGPWGGSELQWWGTLLPRIHAFVPAATILEIGPGQGRWTAYLKDMCEELILVDLAEGCIEACRERFSSARHISYHVNDGKSLAMVPDRSVDFAFSFDSLVHAEADVLQAYAQELSRTLKPDGVAFLHHSNMGGYRWQTKLAEIVPKGIRRVLTARGLVINLYAWRARSTSAELFEDLCVRAGLACIGQEKIAWEYGQYLTDVISLATPSGSRWERPNVTVRNPRFMEEARRLAGAARLYAASGFALDFGSRERAQQPATRRSSST
jgi:ubiquinone/menaquinone biosynthesis C-methylase UbiE